MAIGDIAENGDAASSVECERGLTNPVTFSRPPNRLKNFIWYRALKGNRTSKESHKHEQNSAPSELVRPSFWPPTMKHALPLFCHGKAAALMKVCVGADPVKTLRDGVRGWAFADQTAQLVGGLAGSCSLLARLKQCLGVALTFLMGHAESWYARAVGLSSMGIWTSWGLPRKLVASDRLPEKTHFHLCKSRSGRSALAAFVLVVPFQVEIAAVACFP